MDRVDGDDHVKGVVLERQRLGIGDAQEIAYLQLAVLDRVLGDIDARDRDARYGLAQVIEHEALGTSDVQERGLRRESPVLHEGGDHRLPEARHVVEPAVPRTAVAVEELLAVLASDGPLLVGLTGGTFLEIPPRFGV